MQTLHMRFHVIIGICVLDIRIRPHICQGYHGLYLWRKFCHVEKSQISVMNLNKLWHFIGIYAIFVLNLCGEKSAWIKSLWRKNYEYKV